ncbi:MAG: ABC transporter permease [bacterium]|nr:ABC transporter permease [bacterium]
MMQHLRQDVRFGIQLFSRKPGFTVAAVLSLVLGIGFNTAVFTLWDTFFLHPLPVEDMESLAAVHVVWRRDSGEYVVGPPGHSYANYLDLKKGNRSFVDLALYQWHPMNFSGGSEPKRATGMFVTANYFQLLGIRPAQGRFFYPEEDETPGTHPVVVLSHGCWSRLFGADAGVVDRTVKVNGESFTVVGVAPRGFRGTEVQIPTDFWLPIMMYPRVGPYAEWFDVRGMGIFPGIGRLRSGVSLAQAEDDLMSLSRQLEKTFSKHNEGLGARVRPLLEGTFRPNERDRHLGYGTTLGIAVGLILLLACINVTHLLLVRGMGRTRELAVRQSLGASRRRLVTQLLTENLLLFLLGGALSLPMGRLCLEILWRLRPPEFTADALAIGLDLRVLGFTLLSVLLTGLTFGLLPALRSSRPDLVVSLNMRESPRTIGNGWLRWLPLRRLLVTIQVALALGALISAGLYGRSLHNAYNVDLGFDAESLLALSLAPGDQDYDEPRARELYRQILERVRSLPGVEAAALSENRLLRGAVRQLPVFPEGHAEPLRVGDRVAHRTNAVTPGYFATAGIPLVIGHDFDETIRADTQLVAIINETMARIAWPGENPIGKRFRFLQPTDPLIEVIGVARDAKYRHVHEPKQFFFYLPEAQHFARAMTLHVRAEGDPAALLGTVRREIQALAPDLPLSGDRPMSEFLADDLWLERASTALLSVFGVLAAALAALGVYGVLNQAVIQRQRELGIRMALGAQRQDVLRSALGEGVKMIAGGVAIGWVLAAFALKLSSTVSGQLHDVDVMDPLVYTAAAGLLVAVALVGCWMPSRRALTADPVAALRSE